jgi:predicted dehydrogenase
MHDIEVEDTAEALLRYEGGGSGYLYCSTTEPPGAEGIEVHGECGMLSYRHHRATCVRYPCGVGDFACATEEIWAKPPAEPALEVVSDGAPHQEAVLRNFARHILRGEALICDAASGLDSLELANAITLSSAQGREVALPIDRAAYDAVLEDYRVRSTYTKREVAAARVPDPKFGKSV